LLAGLLAAPAWAGSTYPNKGDWIRNAGAQIQANFPKVDAFMWFNMDKERSWKVDSDPDSLAAYRTSWGNLKQGVFLEDYPYPTPPDVTKVSNFETLVGKTQARVGWYETLASPFPTAAVQATQGHGATPYIAWQPYDPSLGETENSTVSHLDEIIDGWYDGQLRNWALAAAANGQPIEISFGHEMNGDWYSWGYLNGHNGNTAAKYVSAYRHVVSLFDAAGATNVSWVWTVNASWQDDFSAAFPGMNYVDRLGMNGFNWGDDPNGAGADYAKWRDFENIFGAWKGSSFNNYNQLVALTDGKLPIMVSEMASAPEPATVAMLVVAAGWLCRRRRVGC
jgi:hypothetical protein